MPIVTTVPDYSVVYEGMNFAVSLAIKLNFEWRVLIKLIDFFIMEST